MSEIVKYDECSLSLTVIPTWEQAEEAMKALDTMGRNVAWWFGDFLNYCEDVFPETWTQLIPDVGWNPKTLQNWKWVCAQVRKNGRYENLSFSHHAVVAKMDPEDQDYWLRMAFEGGWTEKRLRDEIKGPKVEPDAETEDPEEQEKTTIKPICPHCGHEFDWEMPG